MVLLLLPERRVPAGMAKRAACTQHTVGLCGRPEPKLVLVCIVLPVLYVQNACTSEQPKGTIRLHQR